MSKRLLSHSNRLINTKEFLYGKMLSVSHTYLKVRVTLRNVTSSPLHKCIHHFQSLYTTIIYDGAEKYQRYNCYRFAFSTQIINQNMSTCVDCVYNRTALIPNLLSLIQKLTLHGITHCQPNSLKTWIYLN